MSEKTKYIDIGSLRYVAVHYSNDGRLSIAVYDGNYPTGKPIVDVELPCLEGPHANAFEPTVKISEKIQVEEL